MVIILTTPILKDIKPFDNNIMEKAFEFYYSGGNQCVKNQLIITKTRDNVDVYNAIINNFQLKHVLPMSVLSLNTEYKAKIRVYDINGNYSSFSDEIVFWCFSKPIITINNITDGKINNQTYTFKGTYLQSNDVLQSYRYYLYSENNELLISSDEKFDSLLQHEFTGFNNNENYKIELRTMSVHGVESTSGLIPFLCRFIQPRLKSLLNLINVPTKGSIDISAKVIQILGKIEKDPVTYEDGEWVNLKDGKISYQDGIDIKTDFTLQMWCKDCTIDETFLKMYGDNGATIELQYYDDKIHVFEKYNNLVYHIASDALGITNIHTNVIYIYFQKVNSLLTVKAKII